MNRRRANEGHTRGENRNTSTNTFNVLGLWRATDKIHNQKIQNELFAVHSAPKRKLSSVHNATSTEK